MAENPLTKLPVAGQLIVALVLFALVLGGFWWLKLDSMLTEIDTKKTRLEELQRQIRALEVTAAKLQDFQREVALLEAKLETLKRILPADKETPDLMRRIQSLAAGSNLIIKKFNPANTVSRDFYQEWPINVDVEGTYHNLGAFFDRVGRLSRLVNVGNLKIKAQTKQTASNTIAASCVATTFVYLETPPGAPGAPGGPGVRP